MKRGDLWSSITHIIGGGLAVIGGALLIVIASRTGDPWKIVTCSVYSFSLIALFTISALYHGFERGGRARAVFERLDYSFIYVLIAGTCTPVALVSLRGIWGWVLFSIVWGLGALGIVFANVYTKRTPWLNVTLYVLLGWSPLIVLKPLLAAISLSGLSWLLLGGLFYMFGSVFFILDHINWPSRIFGFHELWHIAVILGAASHYWFILTYVII